MEPHLITDSHLDLTQKDPQQNALSAFNIDTVSPLDPKSFPNLPRPGVTQTPTTMGNTSHLLVSNGISVKYNNIKKKIGVIVPNQSGSADNSDNVAIAHILSLAALNSMSTSNLLAFVEAIGDRNQYNPVADWISQLPWDGIDRLDSFYKTLVHAEDFSEPLKKALIFRWLLSAVAAVFKPHGFKARGVLTLQGPQSIGKTSWISALIPDQILRDQVIKLDHHLDASNKDSIITAIAHWIVEIGELDSSFKKDVARLKGFLTSDRDKLRRPFGRTDSEYPRRTVFCATVNEQNFLVDLTGNTRWWTIPVTAINFNHGINMQQLFTQVVTLFNAGEQWWLTDAEEEMLNQYNKNHRTVSAIHERIIEVLDLEKGDVKGFKALSANQILNEIGIRNPTQPQFKECHAVMRELFGEPKKINGTLKWRVLLKTDTNSKWTPYTPEKTDEADLY
jgi:predicted P-loop ATPase